MAENETTEHITTVLDKDEINADTLWAESLVDSFLYLIHGSGSNRDRKINLNELRTYMNQLIPSLGLVDITGTVISTVNIDGKEISLEATGEGLTENSALSVKRDGIKFRKTASGNEVIVTLDPSGLSISVTSGTGNEAVTTTSRFKFDEVTSPSAEFDVSTIGTVFGKLPVEGSQTKKRTWIKSEVIIGDPTSQETRGLGENLTVNGVLTVNNEAYVKDYLRVHGLEVNGSEGQNFSAIFNVVAQFNGKAVSSVTDMLVVDMSQYGQGSSAYGVSNNAFVNGNTLRMIAVGAGAGNVSAAKQVVLGADATAGRRFHIVNQAKGIGDYVYVTDFNSQIYIMLAAGASAWLETFDDNGTYKWRVATNIVA